MTIFYESFFNPPSRSFGEARDGVVLYDSNFTPFLSYRKNAGLSILNLYFFAGSVAVVKIRMQ
jgi:hypothetical protein